MVISFVMDADLIGISIMGVVCRIMLNMGRCVFAAKYLNSRDQSNDCDGDGDNVCLLN